MNEYDKILGGFTPLHFDSGTQDDCYVQDSSSSSFVFSLTTNQKFVLKNKQQAIFRQTNKSCINFGGGYFGICQLDSGLNFDV